MQGESVRRVVEPFPHVTGAWISRQKDFVYGAKKGGTTRIIVPDPAAVGPGTFFIWKKGAVI